MMTGSNCTRLGMLHGSLAGALLGLMMQAQPGPVPLAAVPMAALLIFIVVISVSLFILLVVERLFFTQVIWPMALNAALVTLVVVTVVSRIPASPFSMVIGWLVGSVIGRLIGALLCRLACRTNASST